MADIEIRALPLKELPFSSLTRSDDEVLDDSEIGISGTRWNGVRIYDSAPPRLLVPYGAVIAGEQRIVYPDAEWRPRLSTPEIEARGAAIRAITERDRELLMQQKLDPKPYNSVAKILVYAQSRRWIQGGISAMYQRLSRATQEMYKAFERSLRESTMSEFDGLDTMMEVEDGEQLMRRYYRFADAAKAAGLSMAVARPVALTLRFAFPEYWVQPDVSGNFEEEHVQLMRDWSGPALDAFENHGSDGPVVTELYQARRAGEWLRRNYDAHQEVVTVSASELEGAA